MKFKNNPVISTKYSPHISISSQVSWHLSLNQGFSLGTADVLRQIIVSRGRKPVLDTADCFGAPLASTH